MLNRTSKRRTVTTHTKRKEQIDALKKALGLNHACDINDRFNSSSNCDDFNSNPEFNATHDSSSANKNNPSSCTQTKGLPGENNASSNTQTKGLPYKYFCEGSPDKLMMEALKELNINSIKDFLMAGGPDKIKQFEKEKTRATSTISFTV